jgi:hypothetical protein
MSAPGEKVREVKRWGLVPTVCQGEAWLEMSEDGDDRYVLATDYDHLAEQVRRMREALAKLCELYALPGESNFDRFERVADLFHRETGCMAPGKDESAASGNSTSYEERVARWEAWYADRAAKARLALSTGENGNGAQT